MLEKIIKSKERVQKHGEVFTPRANNIGTELADDNFNVRIGEPGTICTESYMV